MTILFIFWCIAFFATSRYAWVASREYHRMTRPCGRDLYHGEHADG